MKSKKANGFTLIELLIAVTIVSILAAIAYPSYRMQVEKTRRAGVQAELMELAQCLERLYSEYGCYNPGESNGSRSCANSRAADDKPCLPEQDDPEPFSTYYYYEIDFAENESVVDLTATGYTLEAQPITGRSQEGTGALRIDQAQRLSWDENANGNWDPGEDNWRRN